MRSSSPVPRLPRPPAPPRPDRQPGDPWTAEQLVVELIWQQWSTESYDDLTEWRIIALEEALCSRRARRRLRREIRESSARFARVSPGFYGRRLEDVFNQLMTRGEAA